LLALREEDQFVEQLLGSLGSDLASLDHWLGGADLRPGSRSTADLLAADELYVVVGALKAQAVTVRVLDENQQATELEMPGLDQVVDRHLTVERSTHTAGATTFRGNVALVVAAKVALLRLDRHGFLVDPRLRTGGEIRGLGGSLVRYLSGDELRLPPE
jgi:hypothetical protein